MREIDSGTGFAVVLCDMDNLKTLNDTKGHEAGDRALQALADALRSQLRRSDEAYRIGGDEPAAPGQPPGRRARGAPARSGGGEHPRARRPDRRELRVGVYEPGDDPERLVARADEALYQAKRRREESEVAWSGGYARSL